MNGDTSWAYAYYRHWHQFMTATMRRQIDQLVRDARERMCTQLEWHRDPITNELNTTHLMEDLVWYTDLFPEGRDPITGEDVLESDTHWLQDLAVDIEDADRIAMEDDLEEAALWEDLGDEATW